MSLIGSTEGECETTEIFIRGSVHYITVLSDPTGVRALKVKLTNGRTFEYGKQVGDEESNLTETSFSFEDGAQLLGVFGKVSFDAKEKKEDKLVSVGFFRDDCSMTRDLYFTEDEIASMYKAAASYSTLGERYQSPQIFGMVLIVYSVLCTMLLCYCWLKNRGSLCQGKKRQAGNESMSSSMAREGEIEVNSLDMTP